MAFLSVVLGPLPHGLGGGGGLVGAVAALGGGRVNRRALILDVGDVAVDVVGAVGHDLDAAVGEVDAVLALQVAVLVLLLGLVEAGTGVLVLHAVLVGVGLGMLLVLWLPVDWATRRRGRGDRAVSEGNCSEGSGNDECEREKKWI